MTSWQEVRRIETRQWRCGFCGREVASNQGWEAVEYDYQATGNVVSVSAAICPRCDLPSIIGKQGDAVPPSPFGNPVDHLPPDVNGLYEEARRAVGHGAPNSAALACRKILMHVGVEKGADEG